MLTVEEIRKALHADRVVALNVRNPHGPLGLEHIAAVMERLVTTPSANSPEDRVARPIILPSKTWEKLEELAKASSKSASRPFTPSEVAAAILQDVLQESSSAR